VPKASQRAAQRLVTGDREGAASAVPLLDPAALIHSYSSAFTTLLIVLAAITIVTALVIFLSLSKGKAA
jgi:hypothetical protein